MTKDDGAEIIRALAGRTGQVDSVTKARDIHE